MKISYNPIFTYQIESLVDYIAKDKPKAARSFYKKVKALIKDIPKYPYSFRKSFYYENDDLVRDLIFDGYTIVFRIRPNEIEIIGLIKNEEFLGSTIF